MPNEVISDQEGLHAIVQWRDRNLHATVQWRDHNLHAIVPAISAIVRDLVSPAARRCDGQGLRNDVTPSPSRAWGGGGFSDPSLEAAQPKRGGGLGGGVGVSVYVSSVVCFSSDGVTRAPRDASRGIPTVDRLCIPTVETRCAPVVDRRGGAPTADFRLSPRRIRRPSPRRHRERFRLPWRSSSQREKKRAQ